MRRYDIVGLGSLAMDRVARVESLAGKGKRAGTLRSIPGGVMANTLWQAALLGAKVRWCGAIGKDETGRTLIRDFRRAGIATSAKRYGRTHECFIVVDAKGERSIYGFPHGTLELSAADVEHFRPVLAHCRHFHTELANIRAVAALKAASIAKSAGARVFVDVDSPIPQLSKEGIGSVRDMERLLSLSDVIKFSREAFREAYARKYQDRLLIRTEGARGCTIFEKGKRTHVPGLAVRVKDSTGAGDAFMGAFSVALLEGKDTLPAARFANACGALCCRVEGARSRATRADAEKLLR